MADKKISEMDYKQLAVDDQFPTINASSPTENFYALGGDIPILIGILQWNSSTIYTPGQIVIYNGLKTKGMFLVVTTTSAGNSPDNLAGFNKFKSLGLVYVENLNAANDNIAYQRTGYINVSLTGAAVNNFTIYSDLITSSTSYKVSATLFRNQAPGSSVSENIVIKSLGITAGSITFYVEKSTAGALGGVRIAYTIEG